MKRGFKYRNENRLARFEFYFLTNNYEMEFKKSENSKRKSTIRRREKANQEKLIKLEAKEY
jgi:hypothetical protein